MGLWRFNTCLTLGKVYCFKFIFNHYCAPHRSFIIQDSLKDWLWLSKGHSPHSGANRGLPLSRNQCLWKRWCPPACHPFCHYPLWGCHRNRGEPWPEIHLVHIRWGSSLPGLWWILVHNAVGEAKQNLCVSTHFRIKHINKHKMAWNIFFCKEIFTEIFISTLTFRTSLAWNSGVQLWWMKPMPPVSW